jgi:hypothetical protein
MIQLTTTSRKILANKPRRKSTSFGEKMNKLVACPINPENFTVENPHDEQGPVPLQKKIPKTSSKNTKLPGSSNISKRCKLENVRSLLLARSSISSVQTRTGYPCFATFLAEFKVFTTTD